MNLFLPNQTGYLAGRSGLMFSAPDGAMISEDEPASEVAKQAKFLGPWFQCYVCKLKVCEWHVRGERCMTMSGNPICICCKDKRYARAQSKPVQLPPKDGLQNSPRRVSSEGRQAV